MGNAKTTITAFFCIALLLVQSGCAPTIAPDLTDEERTQLGRVGIVSENIRPDTELSVPAKGWFFGAGRKSAHWAGAGFRAPFSGGSCSGDSTGLCGVVVLAAAIVAGVVGGVSGSVVGAVQAEPYSKVDRAEKIINAAINSLDVHERLAATIASTAEKNYDEQVLILSANDTPAARKPVADHPPPFKGVDTYLEISELKLALDGDWDMNPPLTLVLSFRLRLVRAIDGTEIYKTDLEYHGRSMTFFEWSEYNAEQFLQELQHAYGFLAGRACGELFLESPDNDHETVKTGMFR